MKLKTTIEFFEDTQAHIREMEFSDANEAFILNSLSEGYLAEAIEALKKEKEYKKRITELVKLIETFAQEIREKYVGTDFCGLCEYDADFSIGESGCSMNECPGFDRNDCFSIKKSFREKYIDWSEVEDERI